MRRRGFTLIELLVVIGVIAILMSILLPALSKARDQARATVCLAHLHQWGLIINMYLQDNRDCFWADPSLDLSGAQRLWMNRLADLYGENDKFRLCPSAKQPNTWAIDNNRPNAYGSSKIVYRNSGIVNGSQVIYEGSYGINHWLNDVPTTGPWAGGWRAQPERQWKKLPSEFPEDIPSIMDCCWYGGNPENDTTSAGGAVPPENDWLYNSALGVGAGGATSRSDMARFCLDRHNGAVNGVFLDGSAQRVRLAELWTLKWHRESLPNYNITISWAN